jgi:Fe-S-cluster containining protein
MKLLGECKRCGKCCINDINWIHFNNKEELEELIEALEARGYKIKQVGNNIIHAEFPFRCNKLTDDNKCSLQGDKKPKQCTKYPQDLLKDYVGKMGLDLNKCLPSGCGFVLAE